MYRNRFRQGKTRSSSFTSYLFPVLSFLIIIVLFYQMLLNLSATNTAEQKKSLERALSRSVVHCYAVEGSYPSNLEYLKENYGIYYDPQQFFVDYQPIGSNIMPNITVIYTGDPPNTKE